MSHLDPAIAHLLRRAGFGLNAADADSWNRLGVAGAVAQLVDYESVPDDVDDSIGVPGYLGTTSRGPFEPDYRITDARQRWLFRLVHTQRPLQEKMALFWHNHFATGFGKIAGQIGPRAASRALGAKPDPNFSNLRGQLEVFRDLALGSFEHLLRTVSQDPAMVAWLDGDTNSKEKPQENYARELMELFTIGVDTFTESDVYEGARVFTGWNLRGLGFDRDDPSQQHVAFFYNQGRHDVEPKTFSFPIYPDGGRTIPGRPALIGMQDGHDLIGALVRHPATGPRLARKLYGFFVNEFDPPDEALVQQLSATYWCPRVGLQHPGGRAAAVAVKCFPRPGEPLDTLFLAGRARRSNDPGGRVDRVLGRRHHRSACQHGADTLRAAQRVWLVTRPRLVLDGHDAGANELRRVAR